MNDEYETCEVCGDEINPKNGHYHIEVTDWCNEDEGTSEEFFYHRDCYRFRSY